MLLQIMGTHASFFGYAMILHGHTFAPLNYKKKK